MKEIIEKNDKRFALESKDAYRILIPSEFQLLRESIEKSRLRIIIDCLLNTGMRYIEFKRFSKNLEWFDTKNNAISLPAKATKTKKQRVIHLTPQFSKELTLYLREHKKLEVPGIRSMETNLIRWYAEQRNQEPPIDVWYPSPKTFRKTWESWLLAVYPEKSMTIALSQGHSAMIAYTHYMNLDPRLKSEMDLVRKMTEGWGL